MKNEIKFQYISGRKMYYYLAYLISVGYAKIIPAFKKWFIMPLDLIIIYRKNNEDFWFGDRSEQYSKITQFFRYRPQEIIKLRAAYEKKLQKITQRIKSHIKYLARLSNNQIALDLRDLFFLIKSNFQLVTIARRLDMDLVPKFKEALSGHLNITLTKADALMSKILISSFPSYLKEEENAFYKGLWRLRKPYKRETLQKFFNSHLKKYEWVNLSYYHEPKLTITDLCQRLNKNRRLDHLTLQPQLSNLPPKLKKEAETLAFSAYLKDYTRGKMAQIIWFLENYFDEISRRTRINKTTLKSYTDTEIINFVLKNKKVPKKLIVDRLKFSLILNGKIYVGNKAYCLYKKYHLEVKAALEQRSFTGRPAARGRAIGKALVTTKGPEDLKKTKNSVILVVPNTNPAYVPFLSKVKGIVAEEGGVTAHVSIIAREYNIPAVVGIQNATKIFKSGDLVEVDANKGIVRILKRK